ncbi:hypothetical protein [Lentzea waywayandensis]|uniref:hypothetical protein n=1 Tax=Lentzea waywayandensis TaxID=84724 RepID=UPI001160DEE7
MHHSAERRLGDGETVGVYDLDGGTFDANVLWARPHGMATLGTPEGVERLGGIDFDSSLTAFSTAGSAARSRGSPRRALSRRGCRMRCASSTDRPRRTCPRRPRTCCVTTCLADGAR